MPPDQRRAAIVEATLPLVVERGASVTTAEIAAASGVAEGTIYRAFPDKATLMFEVVVRAFQPDDIIDDIEAIDPSLPLDRRLTAIGELVVARMQRISSAVEALRSIPHDHDDDRDRAHAEIKQCEAEVTGAVAKVFDAHADELRIQPVEAATMFRGLLLAVSHPLLSSDSSPTVEDAVAVVLHGAIEDGVSN